MIKRWWPARHASEHVKEDILLLFIDGVLDKRQEQRIAQHLRDCWHCRSARDRLESAIGAFMDERQDDLRNFGNEDGEAFARRVAAAAAETPDGSQYPLLRRGRHAMWPLAAAAALAAVGSWAPLRDYIAGPAPDPPVLARTARELPPFIPKVDPIPKLPSRKPSVVPRINLDPPVTGPSAADLDAAELAVYLALHDLAFCRDKAVSVVRVPGQRIQLTGALDGPAELEQLAYTLSGFDVVELRVDVTESLPQATTPETAVRLESKPPLLRDRLKQHFDRHSRPDRVGADIADYSNRVVRLTSALHFEAQAVRTLSSVFTMRRIAAMNPVERAAFTRMAAEHLNEMRQTLNQLEHSLDELDHSGSSSQSGVTDEMNWAEIGVTLERHAARMDYLASGLFAGLALPDTAAETAWRDLRDVARRSQKLLSAADETARAGWRDAAQTAGTEQ